MKKLLLSLAIILLLPSLVRAQSCPASITALSPISCWVPPSSGTTINDLVDANPLTIASGSTFGLQAGNTIGCGTGSSAAPSSINSGCNLTSTSAYQPTTATLVMKFAGTGGPLAQFGSTSAINAPFQYFELYLDTFGRLSWGVYNFGSLNVLQSGQRDRPTVFADGNPHIVVASIGANGMRLYADGSFIGNNNVSLANYVNGLWLFGNATLTGAGPSGNAWPYAPAQTWFNGTLYYWAWWSTQLTDAQAQALSNPGTNPSPPIANNYVTITGNLGSLAMSQGYAFANSPVTFTTERGQLPACSATTPVAASQQTYYTDALGNLPSTTQLPQGAHVNMLWAGTTTPLIMPCQSTIAINTLIPAQNPLPDAVSAIILNGAMYQGNTVSNPPVGTIGPATITAPGTLPYTGAGGTVTINRNLGPQVTVTLTASSNITFSNLLDGGPPITVDVIEGGAGGFLPTFFAPTGFTLVWSGITQPPQPSTAVGSHSFYQFTVEGTTIFGLLSPFTSGTGTFPLTATANFNRYSGININTLNLVALTAPTPSAVATCTGTCATTYTYEITCNGDNSTTSAVSSQITATNATSLSSSNHNLITWSAGTGCYGGYGVYGRLISGGLGLLATCTGISGNCTLTSYNDDGSASVGAAPPASGTSGTLSAGNASLTAATVGTLGVTNNATVGGTLGVTGNTTASGTLGVTGLLTASGGLSGNGINNSSCSAINGVVVAAGCTGADIGAQVNTAIAALPTVNSLHAGTVYIPAGTYSYATTINRPCSVTIAGDPQGGTFLTPNSASMDGIATIGPTSATPIDKCFGGIRDITFLGDKTSGTAVAANIKLIHISNTLDQTIRDVIAWGWGNAGDTAFYVDGGNTGGSTTFSERNNFLNTECKYTTNCWIFDGQSNSESLEHNQIIGGKCDTSYFNAGDCLGVTRGAITARGIFSYTFNLNFTGANAFHEDATGNTNGTIVDIAGEGVSGSTMFNSGAAGGFQLLRGRAVTASPVAISNSVPLFILAERDEQIFGANASPALTVPACNGNLSNVRLCVDDVTMTGSCTTNVGIAYANGSNKVCHIYCDGINSAWKLDGTPCSDLAAHF